MIKHVGVPLSIVLLHIWSVAGIFECCPKENNILFLGNQTCAYNKLNISDINLNCGIKIPVYIQDWENFGYTSILPNGTILDDDFREVKYCHAIDGDNLAEGNKSVYIICHELDTADDFAIKKHEVQNILICISAAFVILTIIVYFMVPSLLDLQGICMVHALVGLALAYISLSVIQLVELISDHMCLTFAYLIYFSFFYMFFWLVALSFHIWRTTVKPHLSERTIRWSLIYHIFAIGGAAFFLVFILFAHYSPSSVFENIRPGFGKVSCWFESKGEIWIYFYGPIIVLLIINIIFYVCTVVSLWPKVDSTRNKISKYRVKLCLRLCLIMGLTWTIEIFTFILSSDRTTPGQILLFILDLVNALQGVLIFLVLVVFRKRVRRSLASKNLCNIKFPNSWRYLEDEEIESGEEKANGAILRYTRNEHVDNEVAN